MKKRSLLKRLLTAYFKCFTLLLIGLSFFSYSSLAQGRTIKGRVVNAANEPVAGVTIGVKGKPSTTTVSDENGKYTINANIRDVLVFSSVGFQPKEERIGSSDNIDVALTNITTSMNEVVVVGYGTVARKNLTTSISRIDPKNVPQAANSSVYRQFSKVPNRGVTSIYPSGAEGRRLL
jgi:hypothetical protein